MPIDLPDPKSWRCFCPCHTVTTVRRNMTIPKDIATTTSGETLGYGILEPMKLMTGWTMSDWLGLIDDRNGQRLMRSVVQVETRYLVERIRSKRQNSKWMESQFVNMKEKRLPQTYMSMRKGYFCYADPSQHICRGKYLGDFCHCHLVCVGYDNRRRHGAHGNFCWVPG